jgi:exonuclease III
MFGHVNVYHLGNKLHDIHSLLHQHGLLILGVTETKLSPLKQNSDLLAIPQYKFIRRDASFPGHTGIGTYIHESLIHITKRRHDLESDSVESLWFEIRPFDSTPVLLGIVYRNPASSNDWFDNYLQMMDSVNSYNLNTVILGDFNIDLLSPQSHWDTITNMLGLTQLIQETTRVAESTSTLLDHIYTNNTNVILKAFTSNVCMSDHKPIICKLAQKLPKTRPKGHTYITYRSFKKFDQFTYLYDLSLVDFGIVRNCSDPNVAAILFTQLLLSVLNKHAPLRRKRVKHPSIPCWMTKEIKDAMALRNKLKQEKQFDQYKKQRNKVTDLVRQAKRSYFQKLLTGNGETNISRIWQAMNEFSKKSRKPPSTVQFPFSADQFNTYFLTLTDSIIDSTNTDSEACSISEELKQFCTSKLETTDSFAIPHLTEHDVRLLVLKLKNKKSMDINNLNASILKLSLPCIVDTLTYIYNLCIAQNTFPSVFKEAKVIPLPKASDTTVLDNFRPISILPILSKPLERHIHTHLIKYVENKTLLHPYQSGFRPNYSCQSALTHLCDTWLDAINKRLLVGAVFLDLRKAFDLVNHNLLLAKLNSYFQNSASLSFFSSYLASRHQAVYLNGSFSSPGVVRCGVPQGSILGPILFCLFINDLPLSLTQTNTILDLFADDSSLHTQGKTIESIENNLQTSINEIEQWCSNNHMALHPKKSKSMLIATWQKQLLQPLTLNLKLGPTVIEQVHEHRVLGIVIDDELRWQSHIDFINKRISRNLFLLSKLQHYVTIEALKSFFYAHCMTHINYASSVWCCASEIHIKKLNALHKRGIKIIYSNSNENKDISTLQKCKYLHMLPLQKQFTYNTAVFMFKITFGEAPDYLDKFFIKPDLGTRLKNYKLPFPRIDLYKTSLAFNGSLMWNSLPPEGKMCQTIRVFKKNIHNYLSLQ